MSKRAFQVLLASFAGLAILSGLAGILFGPSVLPWGEAVNATVDSEYRFTNAFWLMAGVTVVWTLPRVETATVVLRVVLGAVFLGGIGRLLAILNSGWPHPVFRAVLILELVVIPLVLLWQTALARQAAAERVPEDR